MLSKIEIVSIILLSLLSQPRFLFSSTMTGAEGGGPGPATPKYPWSSRVISTKFGAVRGLLFQPKGGYEGVEVFYGLPYATPPVGSLRFMPPVSGSPWSGTKMNESPAPVCPQVLPNIDNETEALKIMPRGRLAQLKRLLPLLSNQSEDCLYLNVYVPLTVANGKGNGPLAVMVFVHGEDFGWGAGHPYDPSLFASQGSIIVVTVTFRVGILGYLNANSDNYFKSPANFALLDIIAALHWTQENIGAFGGDRTNVTLMGHGKGGIFVNFLMISSTVPTGLLFHRVILMSGSALSPLASGLSNGKELAKRFSVKMKCPTEPPSTMLHCLRQLPLQYFLESELWPFFGPSDDGVIIEEGIRENVLRDRLSHYPVLFGVTKAEMLPSLSDHDAVYGLENEKRRDILRAFVEKYYSIHRNEIMAAAIHEYTDWERPIQHPISVRDETIDALADAQIVAPLVRVGDLHSQSNSKSFFYVFEYQSKVSDFQQRLGCVHGEDLLYVFGVPLFYTEYGHGGSMSGGNRGSGGESEEESPPKLGYFMGNFSRNEVQLSTTIMGYFASFIRTGNPNEDKGPEVDQPGRSSSNEKASKSRIVDWPPYDPLYKKYLTIDMKPRVRTHYRAHKLSFWLHLVPDLQRNGYGAPGGHHNVNPMPPPPPLLPTSHQNSGLVILPPEDSTHNSSTPSPPTIQLVGPGPSIWEHNTNQQHGNFYPGDSDAGDSDGFQMYSTALSVTIAIGCSLLILNILIFAAFYYQRDKRRAEEMDNSPSHQTGGHLSPQHHHHHHGPHGHSGVTYTKAEVNVNTLNRRKENGQLPGSAQSVVVQQQMPMPNICGELPPFDNDSYDPYGAQGQGQCQTQGHPHLHQHGQIYQKRKGGTTAYEMPMPDAVLAASMMNHDSPECGSTKSGSSSGGTMNMRRSSLTMKDQLSGVGHFSLASTAGAGGTSCGPSNISYESGSRTVPRPPKRTTPTVKFGPETNLESNAVGMGSSNSNPQQGFTSQTLKPSLKKTLNYSPNADELRV